MRQIVAIAVGVVAAAIIALMVHAATFTVPLSGTATTGGTVPPMAARANYTTNAVTADFTQVGGTYGSIGSWLICGGNTSTSGYQFFASTFPNNNDNCSNISIVTDTVDGTSQVLKINDPSSNSEAPQLIWGNMSGPFASISPAFYWKIIARWDSMPALTSTSQPPADWWTGVRYGFTSYSALFENDFWEDTGSGNSNSITNNSAIWQSTSCPSGQLGGGRCFANGSHFNGVCCNDLTHYHTYEILGTTDGSTVYAQCEMIDGNAYFGNNCIQFGTASGMSSSDTHVFTDRSQVMIVGAYESMNGHNGAAYIKRWEVWACANYASSGCTGSLVTTYP